ncbi:MAG: ATP-binding protein [Hyphomicrobiales bacterium]
MQGHLPKGLTERVLAQRDKIEGERKHVTVLFCDMEGFTPIVEKLGPEEAYGIMDRVYDLLMHQVHKYEGTVNEMTGDGVMALFGAPIALEDAPQRAMRAALSIHREMAQFNAKIQPSKEPLPPFRMRVGIHTGPVVVGVLGNDLRVEFKAVGDTVNLAARMEGLAEPGTTYATEEAFRLTEGFFRFEALGEKIVKGKAEPVKVYRLIAPGSRRTRIDVRAERGLTPFVGRERELELLLDGFERAKSGRGQAFSIIAEAGVGKSRLVYEFRKAVAHEDVTFLDGSCLSYSRGVSYHPIIDALKQNFDIGEADGDTAIREKVAEGLRALGAQEASTFPHLLELLSVKSDEADAIRLSPEARKNRIIHALTNITLSGAAIRPLIMAYENLHWIDKASEESFKKILDSISDARAFLIFTYRPDFVHSWGMRSYHNHLNLNRLSNRDSLALASHLLGGAGLDEQLEQLVLEKTEGVPFFIEEFISSLNYKGIIEKVDGQFRMAKDIGHVSLPSTIQDVIMARVDSLPEGSKAVLQTGSVVGREFSHDLIQNVGGIAEDALWSHLSALKDAELLYERGIYPQSSYVFKHAITQDVVYNSLLHNKKKGLHQKIGTALEQANPERLDEFYEILAYHFLKGEDWQRAYQYNREAGLKSLAQSAYEEAQRYFEDAFAALKNQPRDRIRIEREIDLRFSMRSALTPLGRYMEWGEWIHGAESLAREIQDDVRLAQALNYLSSAHWIKKETLPALELAQKALTLAEKAGHFSCQVATILHLGIFYFTVGDYPKHVEWHQELRRRLTGEAAYLHHGLSSFPGAFGRGLLALGMAELGDFDQIEELRQEALEIAERVEDAFTLSSTDTFIGLAYLRHGELEVALPLLEKGHQMCLLSKMQFLRAFTAGALGQAYLLAEEPRRALDVLEETTRPEIFERGVWTVYPLTILADAYRAAGEDALALATASRALALADEVQARGFETWAMWVMARIHADGDRPEEAEDWYRRTLQRASHLLMRPLVAHCHQGLGKLFLRLGDETKARSGLDAARDLYRSLRMATE